MKLKKILLIFIPIIAIVTVGVIILLGNLDSSSNPGPDNNQPIGPTDPGTDPILPDHTHSWVLQNTIEATCTSIGYKQYECEDSFCYEIYEEQIEELPHTPEIVSLVEATCYETGLTEGEICSVCECILVRQVETPRLEHEYVDDFCIHCNGEYYTPNSYFDLNEDGSSYNYESPYDVESIVIPNEYNGLPVTSFELRNDLKETLESIVIGNNITVIPSGTFANYSNLKNITIGSGVKSIEKYAFSYCTSLEEIIIPDNVTSLAEGVFDWCTNLQKVVIGNGIEVLPRVGIETKELILGNNVKIIEKGAIGAVKKISIPNGIEYIGSSNFSDIIETKEYENGFYVGNEGNPYLVLINTKETNSATFKFHPNCKIIQEEAFSYNPYLESITVPDSIIQLGERAFTGCVNLTSIKIGNNVKYIDENIIFGLEYIEKLTIPSSVIQIKHNSFWYVKMITVDIYNTVYDARNGCNAIIDKKTNTLVAGSSVTSIPSTVEHIGERAFWGCQFSSIKIPESVKTIGRYAFMECHNLVNINIPDSVMEIGNGAFWGCTELKTVKTGNGLKTISNNMFTSCTSLSNLIIGNSVELIDYAAFENCDSLTEIYLPKSIKTLTPGSFSFSSISTIYYEGSQEEWDMIEKIDAFIGVDVDVVYDYILE